MSTSWSSWTHASRWADAPRGWRPRLTIPFRSISSYGHRVRSRRRIAGGRLSQPKSLRGGWCCMKPETDEWLHKAENDRKVARREMESPDPVHAAVCFHAQQCAEKYLKAFLEERGLGFART